MGEALARLAKEDPSFRVSSDEEVWTNDYQRYGRTSS